MPWKSLTSWGHWFADAPVPTFLLCTEPTFALPKYWATISQKAKQRKKFNSTIEKTGFFSMSMAFEKWVVNCCCCNFSAFFSLHSTNKNTKTIHLPQHLSASPPVRWCPEAQNLSCARWHRRAWWRWPSCRSAHHTNLHEVPVEGEGGMRDVTFMWWNKRWSNMKKGNILVWMY